MLCTPWLQNPLKSSRLSCLGRKRPRAQFFSRHVKERFRSLDIQITISIDLATTSVAAAKRDFLLLSKYFEIINYFGNR
jgi:hypothetical protein